jgi:hypothetical protein
MLVSFDYVIARGPASIYKSHYMKYAFLLFACVGSVILAHAQTSTSAETENRIIITVSNNSLSIFCKSKDVTVYNNAELDSCLQKIIPGLHHPSILLDAPNDMDRERLRTIGVVLEKFHCPVVGFQKLDAAKPAAGRRLDAAG